MNMALSRADAVSYRQYGASVNPSYLSVAVWINSNNNGGSNSYVTCVNKALHITNPGSWGLSMDQTAKKIRFVTCWSGSTAEYATGGSLPLHEWHHIGGVYDGSNTILYVDGNQTIGTARTSTMPALNVAIRCFERNASPPGTNDWDCSLAELGYWAVALTPAEMAVLASGASPLSIRPSSLVIYDPMFLSSHNRFSLSTTDSGTLTNVTHPRITGVGG